jgi:hypothetical protein
MDPIEQPTATAPRPGGLPPSPAAQRDLALARLFTALASLASKVEKLVDRELTDAGR